MSVTDDALWAAMHAYLDSDPGDVEVSRERMRAALTAALEHRTADTFRNTSAGRELMAEAWKEFQEHYAAQWEEAYHAALFPTPAPPPATVSRESVAAYMMRHWAKILRADRNPYKETQ